VKWATRRGVHIDRAATAWLIRRFVDPEPEFVFVGGPDDVPADARPFDMRGVELGHQVHEGVQECTFETVLRRFELTDPVLWKLAEAVHEADLEDDRFDAPEAAGLDAVLRGLSMTVRATCPHPPTSAPTSSRSGRRCGRGSRSPCRRSAVRPVRSR
jgi:hypothetical protein